MATSPIYSWPEPDNTDLVKNGALAIRTLGNAIDTTMGTMVAKTVVDAKGDLIAGTAADTVNRLAVGNNGETLVADSSTSTGLDWKTATEQYPWAAYTVTPSGLTVGNGTLTARYQQIGKLVNLEIDFIFGTTSAITAVVVFGLPVTAKLGSYTSAGTVTLGRYGVGNYPGTTALQTTSNFYLGTIQTAGTYGFENGISSTVPFTWGNLDRITVRMTYEAA
jgi:hypothetical protein